jgi:choline dehydrogenase
LAHLAALGDAALDQWLLGHPGPVRHPAATAPMGRAGWPGAVTDLDGTLPGWAGLALADASVLPHVPNANPMLVVLAVAERLAAGMTGEAPGGDPGPGPVSSD